MTGPGGAFLGNKTKTPQGRRLSTGAKLWGSAGTGAMVGANVGFGRSAKPPKQFIPKPIQPSKPIPPQGAKFIGGNPYEPPKPNPIFGKVEGERGLLGVAEANERLKPKPILATADRDRNLGLIAGGINVQETPESKKANEQRAARDQPWEIYDRSKSAADVHGSAGTHAARYGDYGNVGPSKEMIDEAERQARSALVDSSFNPVERVQIAKAYRKFLNTYRMRQDGPIRDLNNWAVKAEYNRLIQEAKQNQSGATHDPARDGDLWSSYEGKLVGSDADFYGIAPIINTDNLGYYFIQDQEDTWRQINGLMRTDPEEAANMILKLSAWGAYGGAAEKYAKQNVVFGPGNIPLKARWTKDDQTAARQFLTDVAVMQAGGDLRAWDEILDETAQQNQEIATTPGFGEGPESDGGGSGWVNYGRGGGGGYGGYGGGGGENNGISYTDANQLKQLINGIARGRLGQVLDDAQIAEFVAWYHQEEANFVNARIAGQSGMQLDPESRAAVWIESKFRDQMGAMAGNNYIQQLAEFLMGGGMSAGAIGNAG